MVWDMVHDLFTCRKSAIWVSIMPLTLVHKNLLSFPSYLSNIFYNPYYFQLYFGTVMKGTYKCAEIVMNSKYAKWRRIQGVSKMYTHYNI
jgi:hypothetical protein